MKKVLMLAFCVLAMQSTRAQTEFTADVDNNWNNPSNWTNGLPGYENDALIPEGLTVESNEDMVVDYDITVWGTFNSSASLTLNQMLFVNGTFNSYDSMSLLGGALVFGVILFEGDVFIGEQSIIINAGTVCTNGSFTNTGECQIEGVWHNTGTLTNDGEFLNAGHLFHCGVWTGNDISDDWTSGQSYFDLCDLLPDCSEIMGVLGGCTDEMACNYSEVATWDDGSCAYGEVGVFLISGEENPLLNESYLYTYPFTEGSAYSWDCTGGAIQSWNGTAQVEVVWDQESTGVICVVETTPEQCSSGAICKEVTTNAVGVEESAWVSTVIFPNPTRAGRTLTLETALIHASYVLLDSSGKRVRDGVLTGRSTNIRTDDLMAGPYSLIVKADGLVHSQTILLE